MAERGFQVMGTDLVRELWQFPQFPFVCADMDRPLPFQNGAFDVVMHVGSLTYMENPVALLRDFHRLLSQDGVLAMTVENVFTMESRLRFLLNGTYRWYPHYQYRGEDKKALFLVNREPIRLTTLLFQLERIGFTVEKVEFGGKPSYHPLLPLGVGFRALTALHNSLRKDKAKRTPPVVNSNRALIYRHVGVLARKS